MSARFRPGYELRPWPTDRDRRPPGPAFLRLAYSSTYSWPDRAAMPAIRASVRARSSVLVDGAPAPSAPAGRGRDRPGRDPLAVELVGHRGAEPDGHRVERPHEHAPGRLDRPGPHDAHRDDRHAAAAGQAGHPGLPLVEAGVRGPGALGVDGRARRRPGAPRWRCRGPAARRRPRCGSSGSGRRPGRTRPSSSCRSTRPWPRRSPGAGPPGAGRTSRRRTGGWRPGSPARRRGCAPAPRPAPATAGRGTG